MLHTFERTPSNPPRIAPIELENRPLISVMIPTYNCYKYIEATLLSVLSQDFDMDLVQIEVVDDCSTDGNIGELVRRVGKGKVTFYRQLKNVGSLRNFETCINRAQGHWVHILHGDDKIKQGFYQEIKSLIDNFPQASAVFTDYIYMNEADAEMYALPPLLPEPGILPNWLDRISQGQRIQPPAILVKRAVYEDLGSFFAVHYGEDWEMWVRIASKYAFAYSPTYLALYRIHTTNITSNSFLSAQAIADIIKVVNIIEKYWPEDKKKQYRNRALRNFSEYFAKISDKIYHDYQNPKAAYKHVWKTFQMHPNKVTLKYLMKIYFKRLIRYKQP